MANLSLSAKPKPLLRGYFHQEAFFTALGASLLLIAKASSQLTLVASTIYSLSLLLLLGISALYHRPHWNPRARGFLKRLDHSAIFILIAGTFTPICLLTLSEDVGGSLLIIIWGVAVAGIIQSIFWVKAPKWLTAAFYVGMGWLVLPYIGLVRAGLGETGTLLLTLGGVAYTIGAVLYALKRPRLAPNVFGYHELFHVLTIVGATLHFIAIYKLIH